MKKFERIAIVGLGQMGLPMAKNLVANHFPVIGYDAVEAARDIAKSQGIQVAQDITAALAGADCIITMLPNGQIVQDVLLGDKVYLQANAGAILLEMSSSAPTQTQELASLVAPHLHVVDAPVSGGVKRAVSGTLTIMAGGTSEDIASATPILECLSSTVFSCGSVGSGHAMKSINNFVSGAGLVAAIEAVHLGSNFGISSETIIDVLNASSGKNNATDVKMKQFVLSGTFASGFALELMAKDIGIAANLAKGLGMDLESLQQISALWSEASQVLGKNIDHTKIYDFLTDATQNRLPSKRKN